MNMNTSILYQYTITSAVVALRNALPEIHAKYTIGNFNLSAGVYDWVARYTTFSNKQIQQKLLKRMVP